MAMVIKSDTFLKQKHEEYLKNRQPYYARKKTIHPALIITCLPLFFILPVFVSFLITLGVCLTITSLNKPTYREQYERSKLFKDHLAWQKGLNGELAVERELENLPNDYYVINDITINNHQIDHVVISSRGIIAIETKNYYGNYVSNGEYWQQGKSKIKSPQYQAVRNAKALSRYLNKPVQPVVALLHASFKGSGPCPVMRPSQLVSIIESQNNFVLGCHKIALKLLGKTG